jgi:protein NrfD
MASERAPYGRGTDVSPQRRADAERRNDTDDAVQQYQGETYYGQPVIKPTHYRWLIINYFFVGGMAGASQIIATVADLVGSERDRTVVRAGRYLALAGSLASPVFLIADLHTPQRWYNMIRIFRPTSTMSIGAWTLAAFGSLSGLTAVAQGLEDAGWRPGRQVARWVGVPAAGMGAMMAVYTGTLLAATSVQLWAAVYRLLPALFGTSSTATAAAALSLIAQASNASERTLAQLGRVELAAGVAELALSVGTEAEWRRQGVAAPMQRQPISAAYRFGVLGLGVLAPLVVHAVQMLTGRHSRRASGLAAIATLIGGFILRAVMIFAGNDSARRPEDYFTFTQPAARETGNGKVTYAQIESIVGVRQ